MSWQTSLRIGPKAVHLLQAKSYDELFPHKCQRTEASRAQLQSDHVYTRNIV